MYNKLAIYCFVAEPIKRGSFSHLVQVIEEALNDDEKSAYKELTEQYESMRELMTDKATQFKRSISQYKKDDTQTLYSKMKDTTIISSHEGTSLLTSKDEEAVAETIVSEPCTYAILENTTDLNQISSDAQEDAPSNYQMFQDIIKGCDGDKQEHSPLHYVHVSSNTEDENLIQESTEGEDVSSGYISLESANR